MVEEVAFDLALLDDLPDLGPTVLDVGTQMVPYTVDLPAGIV